MKIAITGTHSCGKTTLSEAIAKEYNIKYIRGDKAISICNTHFPNIPIDKLNLKQQWKLQQLMFESFNEALNSKEDCVTDGFHLTSIPYGIKYTNGAMTQMKGYKHFVQKVIEQSNKFDHILYLPAEIALEDNNFRPLDNAVRLDIDKSIYSLLKDFDFRTLSGTVKARLEKAGEEFGLNNGNWKKYIVFEGLPRAGKSTQIKKLEEKLKSEGKKVFITTRNDSKYMKEFKNRKNINPYDASPEMLALHSAGIKYDFEKNNIQERLDEGYYVISDRQKFTTMSLFGALGVKRHDLYKAIYDLPDAGTTIYLDTNPMVSVARSLSTEPNSILKKDLDLQIKVREQYNEYAKNHRFKIIPANLSEKQVSKQINKIIGEL